MDGWLRVVAPRSLALVPCQCVQVLVVSCTAVRCHSRSTGHTAHETHAEAEEQEQKQEDVAMSGYVGTTCLQHLFFFFFFFSSVFLLHYICASLSVNALSAAAQPEFLQRH